MYLRYKRVAWLPSDSKFLNNFDNGNNHANNVAGNRFVGKLRTAQVGCSPRDALHPPLDTGLRRYDESDLDLDLLHNQHHAIGGGGH